MRGEEVSSAKDEFDDEPESFTGNSCGHLGFPGVTSFENDRDLLDPHFFSPEMVGDFDLKSVAIGFNLRAANLF